MQAKNCAFRGQSGLYSCPLTKCTTFSVMIKVNLCCLSVTVEVFVLIRTFTGGFSILSLTFFSVHLMNCELFCFVLFFLKSSGQIFII